MQTKYHNNIFNIALSGMLMALVLIFKAIFNFIPIVNGYPLDFYMAFFILGILMIKDIKYKWTFLILTPWVLLLVPSGSVSFWDLLLEYIVVLYIFFPLIYFHNIINLLTKKVNKYWAKLTISLVSLSVIVLVLFTLKFFIHVWAGTIWYTNGNWYSSMVINAEIIFINYAINIPIILMCYPSLSKMYDAFYGKSKGKHKDSSSSIQI